MFTKFISKNIQEKLKARERALARVTRSGNQEETQDTLTMNDLATRTVFVRMCSNKSEVPNILISGGEQEDGKIQFGFYNLYKSSRASGVRGIAGIKDISVEYKGGFKAVRECVVNWTVNSIADLNRLSPYFLSVGKTVVVDWGWTNSNMNNLSKQGIQPYITKDENGFYQVNQEIFTNPQKNILDSGGDYDAMGGKVTNFNYSLRTDGGFDCVTTIKGLGSFLFDKEIDLDGNTVGTRKTKSDKKPAFAPPDSMINSVMNLRDIIVHDVMGVKTFNDVYPEYSKKLQQQFSALQNENLRVFKALTQYTVLFKGTEEKADDKMYGICADSRAEPNILWIIRPNGREDIMVTWGWFEDQILNRYLSFKGGSEDGSGIKMTMRSIDTVLDSTGTPISLDGLDEDKINELQERYDVDLQLPQLGEVLKTNTLIRNSPMLYSINPFNFHIIDNKKVFEPNAVKGIITADTAAFFNLLGEDRKPKDYFYAAFMRLASNNEFRFSKRNFSANEAGTKGKLRNIFINIKEIQKAFGVKKPDSKKNTQDNVDPPGTFKVGIERLLSSMNDNFHNVWKYDIAVDQFDTTNIKVIDKSDTDTDSPEYTTFLENSHKVQDTGIYRFPSFKVGSIVKNQTLEFKIPNALAISVMYGSNKKKGESEVQSATNYDKLFRVDEVEGEEDPYKDKFLSDLETSNLKAEEVDGDSESEDSITKVRSRQVGSDNANPNSPIQENAGILTNIDSSPYKWRTYKANVDDTETEVSEDENVTNFEVITEDIGGTQVSKLRYLTKQGKDTKDSQFKPFYKIDDDDNLVLLSGAQKAIGSYLNASSKMATFDTNSLLPAELGLEVDGIGGILPGDIIHTDYIQNKYKLPLKEINSNTESNDGFPAVYFKVLGTTQKVDVSGWTTDVKSQMVMNKLPLDVELQFQPPVDRPGRITDTSILPPPERPFIPIPSEDEDILPDEVLDTLEFEDFSDLEDPNFIIPPGPRIIPAPPNRPNIPVPMDEEDILPDEPLDDLDFDEIPIFIPPPYPSTLKLRRAKQEIELKPERVPEPMPPDVPMIDIGPLMSEEDFNTPPDNLGEPVGNFTDTSYDNPEPDPRLKPMQPSMDIRRKPADLDPTSLLDQINKQKHIVVQPKPDIDLTKKGEVEKPEALKTPEVQELNWEEPEVVVAAVNDNIKKEQPEEIKVQIIPQQELTILKSTYRGTYEQNQVLYAVREDWRPLYLQANGKPGGAKKDSEGNIQTLLRAALPKSVRQEFFDKYIENPNKTGETRVNTTNFTFDATPIDNDRLLRTDRSIYWYGEFNPNYEN